MPQRNVLSHPMLVGTRPAAQPSFDYNVTLIKTLADFSLYIDTGFVRYDQGAKYANMMLQGNQNLEHLFDQIKQWFGNIHIPHVNVCVVPLSISSNPAQSVNGSGGAYHYGCNGVTLYCDICMNPAWKPIMSSALAIAELVEVYEAAQDKGWNCAASNGEGLSRTMAEAVCPGVLDSYMTASYWLNSNRPNWVDHSIQTDEDLVGNGCSVLFLWWLVHSLGKNWGEIAYHGAATLSGVYKSLTGKTTAWQDFSTAVNARWPAGHPVTLASDNPWG